jgi:radical SAM protein with 4Fe4S-binding SPASM domain
MEDVRVFDKANSIAQILVKDHEYQDIRGRIRRLQEELLKEEDNTSYRSQILQQACRDLLEEAPNPRAHFALRDHVVEELERVPDDALPRYLFYRYRYDVFPAQKIVDDFPPCVQIEPTSICNYRCVFCYQVDGEFTKRSNGHMGMMSLDLFKRVVDQAEGACEAITLASRGEPLICPDFEKMLEYLNGKFLGLKINTNASLLDEKKSHAILQSDINTLVFSADAASEPLYSQLRVKGNLDRVLTNIRRFQEIQIRDYPDSKMITRVSGVKYSKDQDINEMEQLWGNLVDQVAFVDYNPWENTYEQPINEVTTPCSDLWRRTFVWFDGTVNPCDVDYKSTMAVGNVNSQDLTELWKGEKYSTLREAHLAKQRSAVSPCNRCTVI